MNSTQIEKNVKSLVTNFNKDNFIYDLLLAYGISKTSITRLRTGDFNMSKIPGEVLYKKKVLFKEVDSDKLLITIDEITKDEGALKHNPRFVIVTDYKTLLAKDTRKGLTLDTPILEVSRHFDFFLPWAGQEKYQHTNENYADRKASYEMAKLYDILVHENSGIYDDGGHNLNIFLSRLLFCFFAEDTDIFPEEGIFTSTLVQHTKDDGSDVHEFLNKLFHVLNTEDNSKEAAYLQKFPYVNGGLFRDTIYAPKFSKKARKIIIECGELNWSEINPDIFGSMIQAVVNPEYRSGLGMHYTSVPNIMKVIEPLFLNDLKEELEKNRDNERALRRLINRIGKVKIFDPACGSGNFLIIAYKELRNLEIEIWKQIDFLKKQGKSYQTETVYTDIKLSQFYGIELDDFAHEMALLSLWLAEHQMNKVFINELFDYGRAKPILPLKEAGHITCGNATRIDWQTICPKNDNDEVYILGNPPYLGTRNQDAQQKKEMKAVFSMIRKYGKLDYISCWFLLASQYIIETKSKYAFVTTNSICQGEQVPILWPLVLNDKLEINFAYESFKWGNNAKGSAGVTCVIIGVANKSNSGKLLFSESNIVSEVKEINPYLAPAKTIYINGLSSSISGLPEMMRGNYTGCCSALILNSIEKDKIVSENTGIEKFIRPLIGSSEFIKNEKRYCFWITDSELYEAKQYKVIEDRVAQVREERLKSTDAGQNKIANKSHQFREFYETSNQSVIVPVVSSQRRKYIPCGFINPHEIVPNSAQIIYDCETWVFGVITSRMHMAWVKAVAGRLREDIRYSSSICYNTFPLPKISAKEIENINLHLFSVLEEREKYPEKNLSQLYDPIKMPKSLKDAHHEMDLAIERCYRLKPFVSDNERLEYLFKLYEEMTNENVVSTKKKKTKK
ncbi:class I SAM-dependent DNA methyltransferase [Flavobacterium psychrotrophum]|uniref:class I SAM-dependent DNA methyltransferase n=1 Tax=Flavobacterium psychrotrophum TaxID=2294119 RepID=UPI000E324A1E|nr:DNA methyltransferase [Flavobacterium psychrotrophum]